MPHQGQSVHAVQLLPEHGPTWFFFFFSLLVNTHVRDGGGKQHRFGGSQFCCAGTLYEDYKAVTLGTVNWTQTFIKKKTVLYHFHGSGFQLSHFSYLLFKQ